MLKKNKLKYMGLINKAMVQVSRPGVESQVKAFLNAVNSATTTPVSEMPIDQTRGTDPNDTT